MKRFSEQFQNKAKSIRLKAVESADLRERVVSYMEYHPRASGEVKARTGKLDSKNSGMILISGWPVLKWAGGIFAGLFLLTTYLAEQAVPGDSLYAVKVSFNEEVRSSLASTPYEKVVWETERLNRRIAEARLLASEGRLTEAAEVAVVKAVKVHSDNARREIAVLKETDAEEAVLASMQLETSIEVQSTSLRNKNFAGSPQGNSTALLASALAESNLKSGSAPKPVLPSYNRLLAHAEQETTRAYEFLSSVKSLSTTAEQSDIKRRMEDIDRSIAEAMTLASGVEQDSSARELLVLAIQRTQRLVVFMTNIDVRQSVTVEEIVPVTFTKEERIIALTQNAKVSLEQVVMVEEALGATSTEASLTQKLTPAILEAREGIEVVITALATPEYDLEILEGTVAKMSEVLKDAALMLEISLEQASTESDPKPILLPVAEEVRATGTASTTQAQEGITPAATEGSPEIPKTATSTPRI